jgi:hypothetical protein
MMVRKRCPKLSQHLLWNLEYVAVGVAPKLVSTSSASRSRRRSSQAFSERQVGADWVLRQSLIDLASVCELLADELPPPAV